MCMNLSGYFDVIIYKQKSIDNIQLWRCESYQDGRGVEQLVCLADHEY